MSHQDPRCHPPRCQGTVALGVPAWPVKLRLQHRQSPALPPGLHESPVAAQGVLESVPCTEHCCGQRPSLLQLHHSCSSIAPAAPLPLQPLPLLQLHPCCSPGPGRSRARGCTRGCVRRTVHIAGDTQRLRAGSAAPLPPRRPRTRHRTGARGCTAAEGIPAPLGLGRDHPVQPLPRQGHPEQA